MAETNTPDTPDPVAEALTKTAETFQFAAKTIVDNRPNAGAVLYEKGTGPHVTTGEVGKDSRGYSILKAAGVALGTCDPNDAKVESEIHVKLSKIYKQLGFKPTDRAPSFLVPVDTAALPPECDDLRGEIRQKMYAGSPAFDAGEIGYLVEKQGPRYAANFRKAFGTLSDIAGGSLVGFPTLGEVIELQRNLEVFPAAGASEIALPPNGMIQYPKQTGGATAYWVGEAASITSSQPSTGSLDLKAKKLAVLVLLNNELLRFASPQGENLVRLDMARVAALKADLAMLEGTGGTQPNGLITYTGQTSWSTGNDKIITYTALNTGTNGDTFGIEDPILMEGLMPDAVPGPTAYVMRRDLYSKLATRRADAAVPGDAKGPFLQSPLRSFDDRITAPLSAAQPAMANGVKVIRSSQVSKTRTKGSGTTLTYVLAGYFPDWIIGRFGVMELVMNPYGIGTSSAGFLSDQTYLRAIQHIDAGARHPASFVFCDSLLVA